eukprot:NODE_132_length_18298_cov_0.443101.p8 type:complete len:216 gc:universal NODE_132_length_18298_cov_0.443101:11202-11849(+)
MIAEFSCAVASRLPTHFGNVYLHFYDKEHLAITKSYISSSLLIRYNESCDKTIMPLNYVNENSRVGVNGKVPIVRVHSSCYTGEVLGSLRCDCGEQLVQAIENCDVVIYLLQEGRNIGLYNKLRAYNLQDNGYDTVSANVALKLPIDDRDYKMAAMILQDFGIDRITLMTNNPEKISQLQKYGISVDRIPSLISKSHPDMEKYLETKKSKMSHML